MSDRSRRKEILARIEAGEISAEEGIAALMDIDRASAQAEHEPSRSDEDTTVVMKTTDGHEQQVERIVETSEDRTVGTAENLVDQHLEDLPKVGLEIELDDAESEEEAPADASGRKVIKVMVDRDEDRVQGSGSEGDAPASRSGRMRINLAGFLGGKDARTLRLRVGDENGGDDRVRIDLPVGIADAGLRLLERIDPEGDWAEHREALHSEGEHTLLEVVEDGGEHIRISVG